MVTSGRERKAARVEIAGTTHSDERKKLCRCFRRAQDIEIWLAPINFRRQHAVRYLSQLTAFACPCDLNLEGEKNIPAI
jgi:hypothetical protein